MNLSKFKIFFIISLFMFTGLEYSVASETQEIYINSVIQKSGYVGEAYELVTYLKSPDPTISNVRSIKSPEFPPDVKVVKGVVKNSRPKHEKEKGKSLYVWEIERYFLLPQKPGKFTIGESRYVAFIPHERIIYQNFWGPRRVIDYEEIDIKCKGVSFKAQALPNDKNNKFSGCVGDFKIEGRFPPGKISIGNDAYMVFTIGGYGSLKDLKVPNMAKLFSNGCHLKEMDQTEQQSQRDGELYNEVTLTCIFVADKEDFSISPLNLTFFSPTENKYYTVSSEELTWKTTPSHKKKNSSSSEAIEI